MNKIFIFAIGGTGSRVLKSLAMELAAGVVPKDSVTGEPYDVVPIIIDPHEKNKDVLECKDILANYKRIRQDIYGDALKSDGFYATRIRTLKEVGASENSDRALEDAFFFPISEITCDTFSNYVGQTDASVPTDVKMFTRMLYSGEELSTPMQHGFYGQPNLGTVALGAFKDSDYYTVLRKVYKPGDKLFFIGSIFGGTGAAGLPMLISSVRQNTEINEHFAKAPIGALVVMPYFSIEEDEDSKIKQSDFTLKTKTALRYYKKDLDPYVNNLYYLADPVGTGTIKNDKGDGGQKENKAHIIEFIGGLAIYDFASAKFDPKQTVVYDKDNRIVAATPLKYQFTVMNVGSDRQIDFTKFDKATNDIIMRPMIKYHLYDRIVFDGFLENYLDKPFAKGRIESSSITREMRVFSDYYRQWLNELEGNKEGHNFKPFSVGSRVDKDFSNEITSILPKTKKMVGISHSGSVGLSDVWDSFNGLEKECKGTGTPYLFEVVNHPKSLATVIDKYDIKNYIN